MSEESFELHQITYANCQPGFGRGRRGGYDVRAWTAGIDVRWLDEMPALARWPGHERAMGEVRAALVERTFGRALVRVVSSTDANGTRAATFAQALVGPTEALTAPRALWLLHNHPWKNQDDAETTDLPGVALVDSALPQHELEGAGERPSPVLIGLLSAALDDAAPCAMFEADHDQALQEFHRLISLLPNEWQARVTWSTWDNRPGDRSIRLAAFRSGDRDLVRQLVRGGHVRLANDIRPGSRYVQTVHQCLLEGAVMVLADLMNASNADGLSRREELDILAGVHDPAWRPTTDDLQVLESVATLRERLSPQRYVSAVVDSALAQGTALPNLFAYIQGNDVASDLLRDTVMHIGRRSAAEGNVLELQRVLARATDLGCGSTAQVGKDILESTDNPSNLSPEVAATLLCATNAWIDNDEQAVNIGCLRPISHKMIESVCGLTAGPEHLLQLLLKLQTVEPSTSAVIAASIIQRPQLLSAWAHGDHVQQPGLLLRELAVRLPNGLLGAASPVDPNAFARLVEIDAAVGRLDTFRLATILNERRLKPTAELLQRIAVSALAANGKMSDSYRRLLETCVDQLEPALRRRVVDRLKSDNILFASCISSEALVELPTLLKQLPLVTRDWVRTSWWPKVTTAAIRTGEPYVDDLVFTLAPQLCVRPLTLLQALIAAGIPSSNDVSLFQLFRLLVIHASRCPLSEFETARNLLQQVFDQYQRRLSQQPQVGRLLDELPETAWRLASLLLRERPQRRGWFGRRSEVAT